MVSAALRPASEAPTITMRPLSLNVSRLLVLFMRLLCDLSVGCPCPSDGDGLNGTGRGSAQHVLALRGVWLGIVPERFRPMEFEDAGGQKTTLGIGLAAIEIHHDLDGTRRCRRWCHWLFLSVLMRFLR